MKSSLFTLLNCSDEDGIHTLKKGTGDGMFLITRQALIHRYRNRPGAETSQVQEVSGNPVSVTLPSGMCNCLLVCEYKTYKGRQKKDPRLSHTFKKLLS